MLELRTSAGPGAGSGRDLSALREQVRRLERGVGAGRTLPFGVAALDAALPGGGLALGALHEVMGAGPDEEDGAVAAAFAAGILARLARTEGTPILWCLGADDLYAPALAAYGLAPERLLLARCRSDEDILWAMEEGLRSAVLAAVIGEVGVLTPTAGVGQGNASQGFPDGTNARRAQISLRVVFSSRAALPHPASALPRRPACTSGPRSKTRRHTPGLVAWSS